MRRSDMSLAASLCFFAYLAPMAQLDLKSRAIRGAILLVYSATLCLSLSTADGWNTDAVTAVKEVFQSSSQVDASLIIIVGKSFSGQIEDLLGDSRGAAVFDVTSNTSRLDQVVASARQVFTKDLGTRPLYLL
ncbi:uncharacterized protein LOC135106791 [Scylla paramamosain]|uniref:uncharacterized protein LOC135106791 n=1 Tax=Scylla paramamosain TaxID=85552 RepID=UPI0030829DFB